MPHFTRRTTLKTLGVTSIASSLLACTTTINNNNKRITTTPLLLGHVVIVGGGFGGATAAKYLRLWGEGKIAVTLIERQAHFISCPMSNLVIGGSRKIDELTFTYDGLRKLGVTVLHGEVNSIDTIKHTVGLNLNNTVKTLNYDRLILSPGVDFLFEQIAGLDDIAQKVILHAWKAGPQTVALRQQIEAMPDGGTIAISIPKAPYRCPPGPYERACQIANYLKTHKPNSKITILDANDDVQSKKSLFMKEWNTTYKGIVEYRHHWEVKQVRINNTTHRQNFTAESELGDTLTADVLNLIPPMQASAIAQTAGVINVNHKWCDVDWLTMESTAIKNVHIIGDAVQIAPGMPKSGHMANQHGKVAAAAIVELMNGRTPSPLMMTNTCYSYVDNSRVVHVASVHRYDTEKKTMLTVTGAGGLSAEATTQEGVYAWDWAKTIWSDTLGE